MSTRLTGIWRPDRPGGSELVAERDLTPHQRRILDLPDAPPAS